MKKFRQIHLVFLLLVFLASCKGQYQTDGSKEDRSQLKGGMSNNSTTILKPDTITTPNAPYRITRKIKKDKDGNLLFAAYNNIVRHDGRSFTNLSKQEELDGYGAFDVLEDQKGNIWIASTLYGVFRHNEKSLTHFTTDDGLAHNRSMCIYEDKEGNIWIGGQGGVSCYDGKSFRNFTTNEGLTDNDVNTIMEDKTGKIWFGTRGNVSVYDPSSSIKSTGNKFTEIRNDQDKPFTNVWSIIEDKNSNIWIGGKDGLWRYNGFSFKNFTTEFISYVYEDKKGNIWTTSNTGILTRYDEKSLVHEQATGIQIFKGKEMSFGISEDKNGNIWVGNLNGVYRYDGKTINYFKDKLRKN
ncbi:MAG: two-component regulator propeller domain-containing protein [Saprospiraceae bacterium]